jgi:hypothetical protein
LCCAASIRRKLGAIGESYCFAHAEIRLSAMFILEAEIGVAKDAFAVKFTDIIARHEVLYGPDPFVGHTVSREAALSTQDTNVSVFPNLETSICRVGRAAGAEPPA